MTINIAQTAQYIKLQEGVTAYGEGRISKQKLNRLYETVINTSFVFFEKHTTTIIPMLKPTRKHGVMLRRSLRHSA